MKKSLVLAMAMALGVSATAFAANPFSDVPAGHWAYGSVAKLAAAGIVDGYPDGTFKGDNLMTRYEMAQIVAKAYAKGAIGADDKLMAEFADELDNLGVRVAKLEKKADNVKITGEARFSYKDFEYAGGEVNDYNPQLRTRLYVNGAVNDNWTYGAMIENTHQLDTNSEDNATTKFRRAFVKGNMDGVTVTAGRQYFKVGSGYTADLTGDAVKVDFGKVLKATAFYGRFDSPLSSALKTNAGYVLVPALVDNLRSDTYGALLSYKFGAMNAQAAYYNTELDGWDRDIYTIGLGGDIAKNLNLYAEYLKSSEEYFPGASDDGWAATLKYMGAKASKANSWGAYVSYYDQAGSTMIDHATEFDNCVVERAGIKGYEVGFDYTLAKNVVAAVSYYDFDAKDVDIDDNQMIWSRLLFTF